MAESQPQAFPFIAEVPPTAHQEKSPGFEHVQRFLARFGYLIPGTYDDGLLDGVTSTALAKYQEFNRLPVTGAFDEDTRSAMTQARCAMPDLGSGVEFNLTCAWSRRNLTFAFDRGTTDIAGSQEFGAIREAFQTWAAVVPLTFTEVGLNQNPDIRIGWRPANDPDLSMVGGTLAHADFPPGCSLVTTTLPKPVHFDDTEHLWSIGAVPGAFDVQTVALHELGHILGLAHSSVFDAVMLPTIGSNLTKRALTQDDIRGVQTLYRPPLGTAAFIVARHSRQVLDVRGESLDGGANLVQWPRHGHHNQLFRFEPLNDGCYRIVVVHTGQVLDVSGGSTDSGAPIIQWPWHGGDNQRFRLEAAEDGDSTLIAKHSNKVLDVNGASRLPGATVIQWDYHGDPNQRWRI
jgi:Matrixin/Ricin-type beta-trefoil lectin domain-like/Putative peptidoglycan binding domain